MGKKDFQKGIVVGAKPFEAVFKKQEDALNRIADKNDRENEKVHGVVNEVVDELTSMQKKQLYDLNTTVDIKELEDFEKELLLAGLFQLAKSDDGNAPNENQQAYIRSVKKYLDIKNLQTEIDLSGIENLENLKAQKAIFQVFAEFLFLANNDDSFLGEYENLFDLFSVKRKDSEAIIASIHAIYSAVGAQGLCERYGFVPVPEKGSEQLIGDVFSLVLPDIIEDTIEIKDARISSDGKYLAMQICKDGVDPSYGEYDLQIMDVQSGEIVHSLDWDEDWGGFFSGGLLSVSADGEYVVIGNGENIDMIKTKNGESVCLSYESSPGPACFSGDNKRLAYVPNLYRDCCIKIVNVPKGNELFSIDGNTIDALAYSPDGQYLAFHSFGGASVWDARKGKKLCSLGVREKDTVDGLISKLAAIDLSDIFSSGGDGNAIAFSYDGKRIVTGANGIINIWDSKSGNILFQFVKQGKVEGKTTSVSFSPDGKAIVVGYDNHHKGSTIQILNAETGELLKQLKTEYLKWASYTPDGKKLISYSSQKLTFWVGE